jgi:hypothetical protein
MSGRRVSAARRIVVAGVTGILAMSVLSCSPRAARHPATSIDSGSAKLVATRWWSNSAVKTGSTIDKSRPDSATAKLHPSRHEYCGMLEQTLAAGKTILPGAIGSDPAFIASITAFFSELQRVAPVEINDAWRVLGQAVEALVKSGGVAPKASGRDGAAIQAASAAVAADAEKNCNVDLAGTK